MPIRAKNLSQDLRNWIMAQTGLGPCIGEIFYVAPNDSSTSHYRDALGDVAGGIYTNVTDAYNAATAYRNDIIFVAPGAYDEGASIDWTKDNTHLIGLGGPNTRADYSEKNVVIYTDTTEVDYTIHLTGDHCIFMNIGINNAGANAGNYAALYVNGYGNYFENVSIIGNLAAEQLADEECASLFIGTNAHNCKWINCDIGEDCWGNRSAAHSGQVSFIGSAPNGGLFRNCFFRSQSETATVAMITVYNGAAGSTHIGRGWVFDNCIFNNFDDSSTAGTDLNQVFDLDVASGHGTAEPIILHNCTAHGFTEWTACDSNGVIAGAMPYYGAGGGLTGQLTDNNAA
jgi:hypothetical protein